MEMETRIERVVQSSPETVFSLAAAVEAWPRILPHYRWVRVLGEDGPNSRTVEMAARRDVVGHLGIPLRWVAIQTVHPTRRRIEFEHIGGITRGMRVAWTIEPRAARPGVVVQIHHMFEPHWPVPDGLVEAVVGEYFVNGVARRTLQRIAELAEKRS